MRSRCAAFFRQLLRRRRANWLEELEEGIRKHDAFKVCRFARLLAGTGIGTKHRRLGQVRACTPSQIEWARKVWRDGPWGGAALHTYTWEDFRREHLEILGPGDNKTTAAHREEPTAIAHWSSSAVPQPVVRARPGPYQDACGCFSRDRPTYAGEKSVMKRWVQAALSPTVDGHHVRHNRLSGIHPTLRIGACRQQSLIPKPGKVGCEACRLVCGLCDFRKAWHRGLFLEGTWSGIPSCCCGFQRCRHEGISFVDASVDMANAFGSLGRQATEDVIQPRLRDIDKFFFVARGRRLVTEVLAPDGIASGLAQVGLFMGDRNAPEELSTMATQYWAERA